MEIYTRLRKYWSELPLYNTAFAVVLGVALLFHQLEKEDPTYFVKVRNDNRYQLYTESFKRI